MIPKAIKKAGNKKFISAKIKKYVEYALRV
jgi:hypothetical protein